MPKCQWHPSFLPFPQASKSSAVHVPWVFSTTSLSKHPHTEQKTIGPKNAHGIL